MLRRSLSSEPRAWTDAQQRKAQALVADQAQEESTFVLTRALTYASLFIGLLLVFVPARLLEWAGIDRPAQLGAIEIAGIIVGLAGGVLALSCVLTFVVLGRGTPAPFDPPRKLVVRGPYQYIRNPMYLGAALALAGAALFYHSVLLLGYAVLFLLVTHLFVVLYEEPTLARLFGAEYEAYRARVGRWLLLLAFSCGLPYQPP